MSAKQASEGGVKQNLTIRFSAEEIAWLNEIAEKEYRPVASMVRYIVAQYRNDLEAEAKKVRQNQTVQTSEDADLRANDEVPP